MTKNGAVVAGLGGVVMVAALAALGAGARAEAPKLTATACTLDGAPLTFADGSYHFGGLAVAPDGAVIVLDGQNRVRRYRPKASKGCALALDRSLGKDGVLDVGVAADRSSVQLAVDGDGTIYVSDVPKLAVRVRGGKVTPMCGDQVRVNASAASKIVWRYQWATKATRETGDCKDAKSAYLHPWDVGASHLWVIDERAVAYGEVDGGGHKALLYGADAAPLATLALPDTGWWLPERFARCGGVICAIASGGQLSWWDDRGGLTGTVDAYGLVGTTSGGAIALDLDGTLGTTYLLLQTGAMNQRTAGAIYRVDGFAK